MSDGRGDVTHADANIILVCVFVVALAVFSRVSLDLAHGILGGCTTPRGTPPHYAPSPLSHMTHKGLYDPLEVCFASHVSLDLSSYSLLLSFACRQV